jgi:hypothetical protein
VLTVFTHIIYTFLANNSCLKIVVSKINEQYFSQFISGNLTKKQYKIHELLACSEHTGNNMPNIYCRQQANCCFMLVSCLAYSSILKMEGPSCSKTMADLPWTTKYCISEDRALRNHCCEPQILHELRPINRVNKTISLSHINSLTKDKFLHFY